MCTDTHIHKHTHLATWHVFAALLYYIYVCAYVFVPPGDVTANQCAAEPDPETPDRSEGRRRRQHCRHYARLACGTARRLLRVNRNVMIAINRLCVCVCVCRDVGVFWARRMRSDCLLYTICA